MATKKKDDRPMYGQVPLPQVTKELAERQVRKRQLRQPPALEAAIPEVSKEALERQARKRELRQPPALTEPIPQARPYRMFKVAWGGLNRTNEIDTGQLSDASNIDTSELPYIVPCICPKEIDHTDDEQNNTLPYYPYRSDSATSGEEKTKHKMPLGLHKIGDALCVIFTGQAENSGQWVDRGLVEIIDKNEDGNWIPIHSAQVDAPEFDALDSTMQNIPPYMAVRYNTYSNTDSVTAATLIRRVLLAPTFFSVEDPTNVKILDWRVSAKGTVNVSRGTTRDHNYQFNGKYDGMVVRLIYAPNNSDKEEFIWSRVSNSYNNSTGRLETVTYTQISTGAPTGAGFVNGSPEMDYITVHQSRLFGVGNNRVYASEYGDYAGWALDTAQEINESNAWMSTSQSNPRVDGDFTGITTYGGHVLLFREDFLQEVYGTKNPYRIVDIGEYGTIDQRSICEVNGVLYFTNVNAVYAYNGGRVREVSGDLNLKDLRYAVAGTYQKKYYLYCEADDGIGHIYVYDTRNGTWGERSVANLGDGASYWGQPNSRIIGFANKDHKLYALTHEGRIYCVDDSYTLADVNTDDKAIEAYADVDWWFETEFITRHNLTSSSSPSAMAYSNVNIKHLKGIQMLADVASGGYKSTNRTLFMDGFNTYGSSSALAAVWDPAPGTTVNIGTGKDGGQALEMSMTNVGQSVTRTLDSAIEQDKIAIRFKIKYNYSLYYAPANAVYVGDGTAMVPILFYRGQKLYTGSTLLPQWVALKDKNGNQPICGNGHWYNVEVIYNRSEGKYTIKAVDENGTVYMAEKSGVAINGDINTIKIMTDTLINGAGSVTIDDVEISEAEEYPAAQFKVYALYDGEVYNENMTPIYSSNGRTGRLTVRIKLRNTAHYGVKLHIKGTGYVKLHEVELYVEDGGTPYLGTGDTAADGSEWIE